MDVLRHILIDSETSVNALKDLLANLQQLNLSSDLEIGEIRAFGGYAEVHDGWLRLKARRERQRVAVKRFRLMLDDNKDFTKSFARELCVWAGLKHANVLPLLGFATVDRRQVPSLVSEWMEDGNVKNYMSTHPESSAFIMAKEIAKGLAYLHGIGIIHSDLKSDNILVSPEGRPMLCDFGISRLLVESVTVAGTTSLKGNVRWMAIELIGEQDATTIRHQLHTKESDVWAYGMVVFELLSGKPPYDRLRNEAAVIMAIMSDQLPTKPRPERCSEETLDLLWTKCVSCWTKNPGDRPTIAQISDELSQIVWPVDLSVKKQIFTQWGWFSSMAYSPDGLFLATSATTDSLQVWNVTNGTMQFSPLIGHTKTVTCIAWCPTGEFLISGSWDATIRKWDAKTGSCRSFSPPKHDGGILTVAYSADGQRIVSGGNDATLIVWDATEAEWSIVLGPLYGHEGGVVAVAYSPDGQHIVSSSHDGSVCVWDATSGNFVFGPFITNHTLTKSISFHPNGGAFAAGSDRGMLSIRETKAFSVQKTLQIHDDAVHTVQFSPDGNYLLSVSPEKLVVCDADTGEVNTVYYGERFVCAAFSPDGRFVATGCEQGKIAIWNFKELCC